MSHFHNCPHCCETFRCDGDCSLRLAYDTGADVDYGDEPRQFGFHAVCRKLACLIRAAADKYNDRFEARCREALRRLGLA